MAAFVTQNGYKTGITVDYNFLTQVVEKPMRRGVLLNLVLTNKERSAADVKAGGSLGYSNHEIVEFRILCERIRQ